MKHYFAPGAIHRYRPMSQRRAIRAAMRWVFGVAFLTGIGLAVVLALQATWWLCNVVRGVL